MLDFTWIIINEYEDINKKLVQYLDKGWKFVALLPFGTLYPNIKGEVSEKVIIFTKYTEYNTSISEEDLEIETEINNKVEEIEKVVEEHFDICKELNDIYQMKNKDYGNSFSKSYKEHGNIMSAIRMDDKLNRFKTLIKNNSQEVKTESIRDTLLDLANYAIMTTMEIDKIKNK